MNITESEILEAIAAAIGSSPQSAEGMTGPELAVKMGVAPTTVRDYLRKMIAGGRMEPCRVQRKCLDGRVRHTPAYRMKAA